MLAMAFFNKACWIILPDIIILKFGRDLMTKNSSYCDRIENSIAICTFYLIDFAVSVWFQVQYIWSTW